MTRRPVDPDRVEAARRQLDRLAAEHPELTGPPDPDAAAEWEETLMAQEPMKQTAIRLPEALLEQADELAEQLSNDPMRVGTVSRSDVLRAAVERGLASIAAETKKAKRKK